MAVPRQILLPFIQVGSWRVMSLKCQLSVKALHCTACKTHISSEKNSSQSQRRTERNKIWSPLVPFPCRHRALIICQSDRCFSNDGVSCGLNFYRSLGVRDCGMLLAIWRNPPRTESQSREAFLRGRRCCQGGLLQWRQHFPAEEQACTWLRLSGERVQPSKTVNPELMGCHFPDYCTLVLASMNRKMCPVDRTWISKTHKKLQILGVVFMLTQISSTSFLGLASPVKRADNVLVYISCCLSYRSRVEHS